jgi:predicted GNAT superfamily acetyltransferase
VAGSEEARAIELRHLTGVDEFREAVRLQQEVWGFEDIELLPVRLFVVAHKVGGQTIGCYDGDEMVGFLLAIPGVKPGGEQYLHSHMMGVKVGYRNLGLGRRMKLAQRVDALERGIRLVEWTFDPLELKNATFNIERLGAVVKRYVLNQYGTTTSHLHGGLPTDRCVAEWRLDSKRVEGLLAGAPEERGELMERISIPVDIAEIRASDPARARAIQARVSEGFMKAFDSGLTVTGFERTAESGTYTFGIWDSK